MSDMLERLATAERVPLYSSSPNSYEGNSESLGQLTPQEVSSIAFMSLMFNQGNAGLHKNILQYVRLQYGDRTTDTAVKDAMHLLEPRVSHFLSRGTHHKGPISHVAPSLQGLEDDWRAAGQANTGDLPDIVTEIMTESISSDYIQLCVRGGRPRRAESIENAYANPYSKFLCQFGYYGLAQRSTGLHIFDTMFRNAALALEEHRDDRIPGFDNSTVGGVLGAALAVYVNHYPEEWQRVAA